MPNTLWIDTADKPSDFPALERDIEVDVVIIGGGITGLIAAYDLTQNGKKVALVEALKIAINTTGHSTGNLYIPVQPYFQHVISKLGSEVAKGIAETRGLAIDYLENVANQEQLDCNFARRPWYLYAKTKNEVKELEKELNAFKELGLKANLTGQIPIDLPFQKAFVLENQARMNPYQFCIKLAKRLQELGCEIYENTRALDYKEEKNCTVKTANGHIKAKNIIIATHTPIGFNTVQMFIAPYRSYVIASKLKQSCPDMMLWDLGEPHHAISTHPWKGKEVELLLIAGQHHKTGQQVHSEKNYVKLEDFLIKHFEVDSIPYEWSAQHFQAADSAPYIGLASPTAKHTYMATGYFADGLVYGTVAGTLISSMIQKKEDPTHQIYNARRINPIASAGFLTKENLNVFSQYLKDYLSKAPKSLSGIPKGEGKIVNFNNKKCAAYRDDKGNMHMVSAVCTHMKCIVHWNNSEKTWDCPCHGSRFDTNGKVLEGPAILDLEKFE